MNLLHLKFGTHVININMISQKEICGKKRVFNPWEGGKVGNNEIFYMLVNFEYIFLDKSFGLKIWLICFNLEMIFHKKIHD